MTIAFLPPTTHDVDMELCRFWTAGFLKSPADLPFSFTYGGRSIHGIPMDWNPKTANRRLDANLQETIFTAQDPATGLSLRVEFVRYYDFPVVEWTAWLTNTGNQATPLIENLLALDTIFKGKNTLLYHCNGDFYSETGYTPEHTPLPKGHELQFAPTGGRPSDGAFPYYRLLFDGCGLTLAIGWPGQWAARFTGIEEGVHLEAGQELTHLCLKPGETIRSPRISLLAWMGDETRGTNLWRRWYQTHILPRPNGKPMQPKLALCGTDDGEEFTAANESNQIRFMDRFKELGLDFDVWWIDAGWYPCYNENHERRWWITGSWFPDPERFPNGLKPVSSHAAKNDASLLVWFEPERVRPGTWLDREHTDWLLRSETDDNSLLDLGNPQARRWLTDHINTLIQSNGIKIYRQDFNFPILDHWRSNDAPDRQGMHENLHVQGYLQYWDELLDNNPGLWIDSCSSGGRRNDLETMRRSVPLHYTDYGYGHHSIKLAFHRTLFEWIPYFKECTLSWDQHGIERFDHTFDSFSFHCALAAMLFVTVDIRRDDYDYNLAADLEPIWRRAASLLLFGDYYPLTPFHKDPTQWVAWQFERTEEGNGFVQAIRLPESKQESLVVHLQGLDPSAEYRFEEPESGQTIVLTGERMAAQGFIFALPARTGQIWFYRKV